MAEQPETIGQALTRMHHEGWRAGVAQERADVIAWLRENIDPHIAADVERGAHIEHREEKERAARKAGG